MALGLQLFEKYFRQQPDKLYTICQDYVSREQWFLRFIAGKYLGRCYDQQPDIVIALLEKLAVDPVWQVREGAAWGMAYLWKEPDNRVLGCYSRWLEDEQEYLRATAALSLVPVIKQADPTILPLLIPFLDRMVTDEGKLVRKLVGSQIVGKALADTFPLTAKECLQRWLAVPLPITQWQIARAVSGSLADSWPGEVIEMLKSLQCQDQKLVREGIVFALKRLSRSSNPKLALAAQKYAEETGTPELKSKSEDHENEGV